MDNSLVVSNIMSFLGEQKESYLVCNHWLTVYCETFAAYIREERHELQSIVLARAIEIGLLDYQSAYKVRLILGDIDEQMMADIVTNKITCLYDIPFLCGHYDFPNAELFANVINYNLIVTSEEKALEMAQLWFKHIRQFADRCLIVSGVEWFGELIENVESVRYSTIKEIIKLDQVEKFRLLIANDNSNRDFAEIVIHHHGSVEMLGQCLVLPDHLQCAFNQFGSHLIEPIWQLYSHVANEHMFARAICDPKVPLHIACELLAAFGGEYNWNRPFIIINRADIVPFLSEKTKIAILDNHKGTFNREVIKAISRSIDLVKHIRLVKKCFWIAIAEAAVLDLRIDITLLPQHMRDFVYPMLMEVRGRP